MSAVRRAGRGAALLLVVTGAACAPPAPPGPPEEVGTAISPVILLTDADKLDPGGGTSGLGAAVALSGDIGGAPPQPGRILVGAPPPFGGMAPGDAFFFAPDASGWSLEDTPNVVGGPSTDAFGGAVALSGDTAIVGAAGDGVAGSSGAAQVYVRDGGGTWSLQQTLTVAAAEAEANELFGAAVALWGDTAFVAARSRDDQRMGTDDSGAVFVFVRSGGIWDLKQTLSPGMPVSKEHFGVSVSVSGDPAAALPDTLVVGANGHKEGEVKTGAVYVFSMEGGDWVEKQILSPPPALVDSSFGRTAVVAGDVLVVGAHTHSTAAAPLLQSGAAVVFERQNGSFGAPMDLVPEDGATYEGLGVAAALASGRVFVGAGRDGSGVTTQNGAVYVFSKGAQGWKQETVITIATLGNTDFFGRAVAAWGDTVAAGAPGASGGSGAVYVTVLPHQDGASCAGAGECVSGHCVDSVCCDTACDGAGEACSAVAKGAGVDGVCEVVGATTTSGSGSGTGVTGMGGSGAGGTGMGAGGTSGSGTTSGGETTTTTSGSGTTTTGGETTTDGVGAGGSGGTGTGAGAGTSSAGGTGGGTGGVIAETSYYACAAAPGRPASSSLLAAGTLALALLRRSRRKRPAAR